MDITPEILAHNSREPLKHKYENYHVYYIHQLVCP